MEKTQTEAMNNSMETSKLDMDISIPLQNLFDECLNFISVNDFNV
jgi:hypothetical protein